METGPTLPQVLGTKPITIPWKSLATIFYRLVYEPPLFIVRVYYDPKGTTIFYMVVDFQGQSIVINHLRPSWDDPSKYPPVNEQIAEKLPNFGAKKNPRESDEALVDRSCLPTPSEATPPSRKPP